MFKRSLIRRGFIHGFMFVLCLPILFITGWVLVQSVFNFNTMTLTWENWRFLWSSYRFEGIEMPIIWPIVWNTIWFGLLVTVIDLLIAVPAGYAFSRLNFFGKNASLKFIFLMGSFPGITLLVASYFIIQWLGLTNSLFAVVILSVSGMVPWHVYIIKGFFDELPWDLEFSAMLDGCTRFQALRQVLLPNLLSGIGAIAIFAFMSAYGEWLLIRLLIFDNQNLTLAGYLAKMVTADDNKIINYGIMTALGLFYTIPIAVFYLFTQGTMLKVTIGGSKGS